MLTQPEDSATHGDDSLQTPSPFLGSCTVSVVSEVIIDEGQRHSEEEYSDIETVVGRLL